MKRTSGLLLWLGILLTACSQTETSATDLGTQSDLAVMPDLSAVPDLAPPPPTLSLIAGGLGGPGNVSGTGSAARFGQPFAVAADGAGNLYVADSGSNTLRAVVMATGAVTTLAGALLSGNTDGMGTAARFNFPMGVAADGAGNLNGDFRSGYIGRPLPTSRGVNHAHPV